jgi:hypothetical protein
MSFQPAHQQRSEWTGYATLTIILVFIAAIAQALQVPHSLTQWLRSVHTPEAAIAQGPPPVVASPPATRTTVRQPGMCAEWLSVRSRKRYDFICAGADTFDVYETNNGQLNKIGSGRVLADGHLEAELVSTTKNRKGYWNLELSSDKNAMEGTWHGDDPRESGRLQFSKLK